MASYQYIFHMHNLSKYYGNKLVLENFTLSFLPSAKIGVVGVNGSGKSTLLRIMAGVDLEYSGEAVAANGIKIGYLQQEPILNTQKTVWENIIENCAEKNLVDDYNALSVKLAEDYSDELMEEMTNLQEKIEAWDAWDIDSKIGMAMDALNCPPAEAEIEPLSGGERRRVALCRLLLSKPDLLLLDEPTNHLDAESIAWLENYLKNFSGAVIMVTHDRYFLDNITDWTLEIDRGKGVPYEGNYSSWLQQKQKRLEQEEREESARQRSLKHEIAWIQSSPKARHAKSKARINAYDNLREQAQKEKTGIAEIQIAPGPRLGQVVVEADRLGKSFPGKTLIHDLSFKLPAGGIVGVIGANGAGKTTLFKMITGNEKPDTGTLRLGETVTLGYVDQSRDHLNATKTIWEEISEEKDVITIKGHDVPSRAYVGAFNFKGKDQQKKVGNLSGGERNRVHLAKMLKKEANLLLLDEPTNDLDVETLSALEFALENFPGCAVIISHDRFFLDRIATHILAFEGKGHVEWFEGNFEEYLEDKKRRYGSNQEENLHRKFQKFTRD